VEEELCKKKDRARISGKNERNSWLLIFENLCIAKIVASTCKGLIYGISLSFTITTGKNCMCPHGKSPWS